LPTFQKRRVVWDFGAGSIFHQFHTVWTKSSENMAPVNPRSVLRFFVFLDMLRFLVLQYKLTQNSYWMNALNLYNVGTINSLRIYTIMMAEECFLKEVYKKEYIFYYAPSFLFLSSHLKYSPIMTSYLSFIFMFQAQIVCI
jgi:hypothetical protein